MKRKDFVIVLAWPETKCKQAGAWYDGLMASLGLNSDGYYKVGHAALITVNGETGTCEYYDFGRYHSPSGFGRVRHSKSDFDLVINTKAVFSENQKIINVADILTELERNKNTHGEGKLVASITPVDLVSAKRTINQFIDRQFIPYGPFVLEGTNCSRFVSSVIKRAALSRKVRLRLKLPLTISAMPIWNVRYAGTEIKRETRNSVTLQTTFYRSKIKLKSSYDQVA